MPKLYVANATKQHQMFCYRLLGQAGYKTQYIQIGGQVLIGSGDLSAENVDYILRQHEPYGMVRADEIDRTKHFAGLCYAVDKPVQRNGIEKLMGHNTSELVERGKEIRELTAIAVHNQTSDSLDGGGRLNEFDMQIVEEKDRADTDEVPMVAEGIRVTDDEDGGRRSRRGRR